MKFSVKIFFLGYLSVALAGFSLIHKSISRVTIDQLSVSETLNDAITVDQRGFYRCDPGTVLASYHASGEIFYYPPSGKLPVFRNEKLSNIPTSFRWKPPSGKLPFADVSAYVVVDSKTKERSRIFYDTKVNSIHNLPVFSIFIKPADLFDFERGIYIQGAAGLEMQNYKFQSNWWDEPANYHKRGKLWKRQVHFQYLNSEGSLIFESDGLASIHGNATRAYPQKSLRLTATKGNKFNFDFFSTGISNYEDLILRNGGNNWDKSLVTDGFIHELASSFPESELYSQEFQPCVVYINGEYWGLHNLRERFNEDHIANLFGVKKKKVTVIEGTVLSYGDSSSYNEFRSLLDYCRENDLSEDNHFLHLQSQINYRNFLNYMTYEIYAANTDWPQNNVKCFRVGGKEGKSSKWSWVIWDMDYCYGYTGTNAINEDMFQILKNSSSSVAIIFNAMMKNNNFRKDLRKTFEDNFAFSGLNIDFQKNLLNKIADSIKNEMEYQVKRWRRPNSVSEWKNHLRNLTNFIEQRETVITNQLDEYLKE